MDGPGRAASDASPEWRALIDRLYALSSKGMGSGLAPIDRVLDLLGRPERTFPSIHVAGSNGKGSTCAFLASILSASGRTVGLYTSPHLERLEERVQIVRDLRAAPLAPEVLLSSFQAVEAVAPGFGDLTFFEAITAAGLHALAVFGVDVGVIEAGLGARLDATRLVDAHVSVLTDLSLEHTAILGDTIEKIAFEKAHVLRPGRPLIAASSSAGAMEVIARAAAAASSPVYFIDRDISVRASGLSSFDLVLLDRTIPNVTLSLLGAHQGRNALLAVQAALQFDPTLSDEVIRRGLASAYWPGRMEIIRAAGRPPLLLDGAHNPQGAAALARSIAAHPEIFSAPIHLVFGVLADKDAGAMISTLAPIAASVVLTRADSSRARAPESLRALLPPGLLEGASVADDVGSAMTIASERAARDGGWVAVAGSLYLVGEARTFAGR